MVFHLLGHCLLLSFHIPYLLWSRRDHGARTSHCSYQSKALHRERQWAAVNSMVTADYFSFCVFHVSDFLCHLCVTIIMGEVT